MLSRVAETIYWISRYVERAENTARLIDVSLRSIREQALSLPPARGPRAVHALQDGRTESGPQNDLAVIVRATASEETYAQRYGAITEDGLATFFVVDRDNPSSVVSCLALARENARGVREAITSEMWEELNRAYLSIQRVTSAYLLIDGLHDFCRQIRLATQLFQGVTDATMPRDEGFHFLQAGKFLERAGMTARILDARLGSLDLHAGRVAPEEVHRWLALLRSVSGYEAYVRLVHGGAQPAAVAEFLLFNLEFPRSVAFGIRQVQGELEAIAAATGRRGPEDPAIKATALAARLRDAPLAEFGGQGLRALLGHVERQCHAIGEDIRGAYFENVVALSPT